MSSLTAKRIALFNESSSLKDLSDSSKCRLLNFISNVELKEGQYMEIKDNINVDYIQVRKGKLTFTLQNIEDGEISTKEIPQGQFFDYIIRSTEFPNFRIKNVIATEDSRCITIPQQKYLEFANNFERSFFSMQLLLIRLIPSLSQRSKPKRQQIVNNFEEIALEQNTLLEIEGTSPNYLWLILQGEIDLYKRPESLYDEFGKPTDSSKLHLWQNPADSGNAKIGVKAGIIKDKNLICEDALVFQQPLMYSIRCRTAVLAWRYPAQKALDHFPSEVKDDLMMQSLKKYQWLFERLDYIENQLRQIDNYGALTLAKMVEQRASSNFPKSNKRAAQGVLKNAYLDKIEGKNQNMYLGTQSLPIYKHAKKLTGYINQDDIKKLDKLKVRISTPIIRKKRDPQNLITSKANQKNVLSRLPINQSPIKNLLVEPREMNNSMQSFDLMYSQNFQLKENKKTMSVGHYANMSPELMKVLQKRGGSEVDVYGEKKLKVSEGTTTLMETRRMQSQNSHRRSPSSQTVFLQDFRPKSSSVNFGLNQRPSTINTLRENKTLGCVKLLQLSAGNFNKSLREAASTQRQFNIRSRALQQSQKNLNGQGIPNELLHNNGFKNKANSYVCNNNQSAAKRALKLTASLFIKISN